MTRLGALWVWGMIALMGAAADIGGSASQTGAAIAARPQPDCGPTREWNCVVPGCPDCPEILFEGTVCEKNEFEQQTGRECSPA